MRHQKIMSCKFNGSAGKNRRIKSDGRGKPLAEFKIQFQLCHQQIWSRTGSMAWNRGGVECCNCKSIGNYWPRQLEDRQLAHHRSGMERIKFLSAGWKCVCRCT